MDVTTGVSGKAASARHRWTDCSALMPEPRPLSSQWLTYYRGPASGAIFKQGE